MHNSPYALFTKDKAAAMLKETKAALAIPLLESIRNNPQVPASKLARILRLDKEGLVMFREGDLNDLTLDDLVIMSYRWGVRMDRQYTRQKIKGRPLKLQLTYAYPAPGQHNGKVAK